MAGAGLRPDRSFAAAANVPTTGDEAIEGELTADALVPALLTRLSAGDTSRMMSVVLTFFY